MMNQPPPILSSSGPPDTGAPEDPRMAALRWALQSNSYTDLDVWNHLLGIRPLLGLPSIASELSKHFIVIAIDTEHCSSNTWKMTEIGIAMLKMVDAFNVTRTHGVGPHGANLMDQINFYLFRILENSHMPNTNDASRGAEGNRFGQHRFVNFPEMWRILHELFHQPIQGVPNLQGLNHPVVILGHAIGHDANNLKTKELGFDMTSCKAIVRFIDTQKMVRNCGFWTHKSNEIGLAKLCIETGFKHLDAHTACNDIAHTIIAATQLALKAAKMKTGSENRTVEEVVEDLEVTSRNTYQPIGGSEMYCWRCGGRDHMIATCPATDIRCEECWSHNRRDDAMKHVTKHCDWIMRADAETRRKFYEDRRKQNEAELGVSRGKYNPRGRGGRSGRGSPGLSRGLYRGGRGWDGRGGRYGGGPYSNMGLTGGFPSQGEMEHSA